MPLNDAKVRVKSRNMEQLAQYREHLRAHPRLTYLFVELTDRCNLRCLHCGSQCEPRHGTFLDTELLLRTLEQVAEDFEPGSVMICLTGGEPLLHPDFDRIAARVHALGFPWGMTSNGTLIDGACAARLRANGIGTLTLSLDGLRDSHDALRQVPGSFDRTIAAVGALYAASIPVQITTVLHKENFAEREALYEFLCTLHIASWRVINLEPIGRALSHPELLLSREEFTGLLDFIRARRFDPATPMDVRFGCSHYLSYEYEHEVRDNYFLCGSGLYVASILCSGEIYSCLDIERRPELVQGHIARDRFSEVWRDKFQAFRADRSQSCAECRQCPERTFCGGDAAHTWDYERNKPLFCFLRKDDCYDIRE